MPLREDQNITTNVTETHGPPPFPTRNTCIFLRTSRGFRACQISIVVTEGIAGHLNKFFFLYLSSNISDFLNVFCVFVETIFEFSKKFDFHFITENQWNTKTMKNSSQLSFNLRANSSPHFLLVSICGKECGKQSLFRFSLGQGRRE